MYQKQGDSHAYFHTCRIHRIMHRTGRDAVGLQTPGSASPVYRVTIQSDSGGLRTYDVPATGDLRLGDRVRVENGVIYRS